MKCRDCPDEAVEETKFCRSCREKNAARCKAYRLKNLDARKEKDKEYNALNREKRAAYARQYRKNNPEKCREQNRRKDPLKKKKYMQEYADKNRARLTEQRAAHHQSNYAVKKLEINERNRAWFRNNRDKCRDKTARYRAKKVSVLVENVDNSIVFLNDGYTCQLCGGMVVFTESPYHPLYPTIDHIVPLSKGGKHEYANVQTAHRGCNSSKYNRSDKSPTYVPRINQ